MKYKLIAPWLDEHSVVHPIGEIVEMNDKKRADNLVRLNCFEPIEEEKEEKTSGNEEIPEEKEEKLPKTSSRKKK